MKSMNTKKLRAFHGDPAIKESYRARVQAHAAADEIVKGKYWENGKGCAVGCTIHGRRHATYETALGLPEWLARLEDIIFEGLPNGEAKDFPGAFLAAITPGADLEPVRSQFSAFVLRENIERVQALSIDETLKRRVVGAIRRCLAAHEQAVASGEWDRSVGLAAESARSAAESAAWSAAESARSAAESARSAAKSARSAAKSAESAWSAWSAAWSARSAAESAAVSAWSAAESARSAAESAWSAAESAWSAAGSAYRRYRDELLRLLRAINPE